MWLELLPCEFHAVKRGASGLMDNVWWLCALSPLKLSLNYAVHPPPPFTPFSLIPAAFPSPPSPSLPLPSFPGHRPLLWLRHGGGGGSASHQRGPRGGREHGQRRGARQAHGKILRWVGRCWGGRVLAWIGRCYVAQRRQREGQESADHRQCFWTARSISACCSIW